MYLRPSKPSLVRKVTRKRLPRKVIFWDGILAGLIAGREKVLMAT